ncbi:uncharacterized protein LOC120147389 [Hibiscus syriacus]|uniref:uncharacterized protein LOC120147389 n=1 Tax=Hibiscus syriacus TaxID=106335 RepID=UPI0019238F99|nr:uncharacterized protein LOC120147389 [Hibiscus syriacus]
MKNGDSHGKEVVEEKITEKNETREPEEMLEGETNTCQVIPEESKEHRTVTEEKKIKKAESFEDEKSTQSDCTRELQGALEDGAAAVHILPGESSAVNLHTASTLPSEVKGNETEETKLKEDESLEKIQEQTREIEEVSDFNKDTCGRASDNELLTETEDAANEKKILIIAVIEVLKEEVMEDKKVIETSYSTSYLEEMIEDGSGEDELKDKLIQENKLIVEAQKTSENEIIENQIKHGHASISRIETIAVTEKNVELAPPGFEERPEYDLESVANTHVIEEESSTNELHQYQKEMKELMRLKTTVQSQLNVLWQLSLENRYKQETRRMKKNSTTTKKDHTL